MQKRLILTVLLGASLMAGMAANAAGRDKIATMEPREKSTLETFPLRSLDQDDLAEAAIGGALDAPASGGETEPVPAQVMQYMPRELESLDDRSDMGRHRVPVTVEVRAQPVAIEGRTYSWDFNTSRR